MLAYLKQSVRNGLNSFLTYMCENSFDGYATIKVKMCIRDSIITVT